MQNSKEIYELFIKQHQLYLKRIEDRIEKFFQIKSKEYSFTEYNKKYSKLNYIEDYSRAENKCIKFYDFGATLKYEVDYSGCGIDSYYEDLDLNLYITNDEEFEEYLIQLEKDIELKNTKSKEKYELYLIQLEEEKKKKVLEKQKKEYEKLKKIFETNN